MDAPIQVFFGSFNKPFCSCISSERNNNVIVKENNDYFDRDVLFEILMRVDPCNIFPCILVSKECLSVISSPLFRKSYLKRWENSNSRVVGLLGDGYKRLSIPGIQMLPTTILGRDIVKAMPVGFGFFLSKSPKGGLLLFGGCDRKMWYVWKPISGDPPIQLPPPPAYYERSMANIISNDDEGEDYKVILGRRTQPDKADYDKVSIQTFCSRTWKWEQSTLTCSTPIRLVPRRSIARGGIVDTNGVIYWSAVKNDDPMFLVAWDVNEGACMDVILPPPLPTLESCKNFAITYGAHSSLLAAIWSYRTYEVDYDWESVWFTINIWAVGDDKKDWCLLHSVRQASIWSNNLELLTSLFGVRPEGGFKFVSFIPGKSDTVFLGLLRHLFIYNFHSGKLEYVEYLYGSAHGGFSFAGYHPLTMLDLRIWPSCPPSLQLPRCY